MARRRRLERQANIARPPRPLRLPARVDDLFTAWIEHDNLEDKTEDNVSVCVLWVRHADSNEHWQCIIEDPASHVRSADSEQDDDARAQSVSLCQLMSMIEAAIIQSEHVFDNKQTPTLDERAPVLDVVTSSPFHMILSLLWWWMEEPPSDASSPVRFEFALYKTERTQNEATDGVDAGNNGPALSSMASSSSRKALARLHTILPASKSWTMRGLPQNAPRPPELVVEERFFDPTAVPSTAVGGRLAYVMLQSIENVGKYDYFNWWRVRAKDDTSCFQVISDGISFRERGFYQVELEVVFLHALEIFKSFRVFLAGKSLEDVMDVRYNRSTAQHKSIRHAYTRLVLLIEPDEDLKVQFLVDSFAFTKTRMAIHKLDAV